MYLQWTAGAFESRQSTYNPSFKNVTAILMKPVFPLPLLSLLFIWPIPDLVNALWQNDKIRQTWTRTGLFSSQCYLIWRSLSYVKELVSTMLWQSMVVQSDCSTGSGLSLVVKWRVSCVAAQMEASFFIKYCTNEPVLSYSACSVGSKS